jgi:hypothetical protein
MFWIVGKVQKAAVGNWTKRECQAPIKHRAVGIVTNSFSEGRCGFGSIVAVDKPESLIKKLLSWFGSS